MARVGTKTSDFGVSKREGHDSSRFYGSKLYDGIHVDEKGKLIDNSQNIDATLFGKELLFDHENIDKIPDYSIHLALFPVPGFINRKLEDIDVYLERIRGVVSKLRKKLVIGGRLVVIVDNQVDASISRFGYWPFHAYIAPLLMELGLYMRGEVILKHHDSDSTAISPQHKSEKGCNAKPKQVFSHGLIFSNRLPSREKKSKKSTIEKTDTISRDQFLEYTKSVWSLNSELMLNKDMQEISNLEKGDYYSRFIHLYSFLEDTILVISNKAEESTQNLLNSIRKKCVFFFLKETLTLQLRKASFPLNDHHQ